MSQKQIILTKKTLIELDAFLLNYRFVIQKDVIILYWQPYLPYEIMEDKLELFLKKNNIKVDSHFFVSPQDDFLKTIETHLYYISMAANDKCPNCNQFVRIDKADMKRTETVWVAKCPLCGLFFNSKGEKAYPVPDEDTLSAPEDDSSEVKYNTKNNPIKG